MKKIKKFVYLISPVKINNKKFLETLDLVFKTKRISFFQLRLKEQNTKKIVNIGKKIKKLCNKNRVRLIVNDDPMLAKKINSDGCHIGQSDSTVLNARKIINKKIIGVTCHNSKKLIKKAIKEKVDYIAIGSFYTSKTKKIKFKANIKLLKAAKKMTKIPIVAIGGINLKNYKKLLLNKANFLAISSYVWRNKKLSPVEAIRKLK